MARFELISPYPPEECLHRLQDAITPANEMDIRTAYRWVQLAEKPYVRDSLKTFLRTTLTDHGTGTRVRGSLGFSALVKVFLVVWVGFIVSVGVAAVASGAGFPQVLIPFGIAFVGLIGAWLGRLLSGGQDRRLMKFVIDALDATTVAQASAK